MIENLFIKIFSLLSLFFIIFLGGIVIKHGKQLINKLFTYLTIILIVWVFGSFMLLGSHLRADIEFWDRFIYSAVVFWVAIQYNFSLAVTYFNLKRKILLYLSYFLSIFFFLIIRTDFFVSETFYYKYGAHMKAQLGHHLFMGFFVVYVTLFFFVLFKKYYHEKNKTEKAKTLLYIIGFAVLNFIGGTAFLPAYSIPFYPIFLATPLIFSLIIAYSIVYFGLMDIKLILRRYVVFFFSLISLLVPSYLIIAYTHLGNNHYQYLIILLIALIVFNPIKKKYYSLANKYFFSSLYDSNELIYTLNKQLRSSLEIKKIFNSVTSVLTSAFHCEAIAVINLNSKSKKWKLVYNNNFKSLETKFKKLDKQSVCDSFLKNKPLPLRSILAQDAIDDKIKNFLVAMNIQLVMPIKINKNELSDLIFFGPKRSKDNYSNKDLKTLELLANEIGITIENALLYQSVKKFNTKLKKEINKATEQLKIQNKKLIKLDKAKDEFVSIASHQLKSPLTGIRWSTEILMKNKDKNLKPKQLELLENISASNLSLIKLTNDLLDVSHIETGRKFKIIKSTFRNNDVINEVLKESAYSIKTKKLKIDNKISDKLKISADRNKIKQVWQNLITNAIKYTKEKTTIKLYAKTDKDKQTSFYIEDKGIGIPKDQQENLFSKFFRASNASLIETEGTGLGLYIARELIRAHGGEMSFTSKENKGSTFCFNLPK